jgi:ATP-dependent Clp protease ATP-binding subunit ClpB
MIRLDMSEYQEAGSIRRLTGAPGQKGSGILTEAVRRAPFSLILLDELEKADKDVLNIFLQVMDDGRLTDSTGRVVDFTNTIIIATSNAGTSFVSDRLKEGLSTDAIKDRLIHGELRTYFRPEFLNRFDGIVLFKPLGFHDVRRIARLMLNRVTKDLEEKGVTFMVLDQGLDYIAQVGFDPEFGARPLRRAIEEHVENHLAELVLSNQLKRGSKILMKENGILEIVS